MECFKFLHLIYFELLKTYTNNKKSYFSFEYSVSSEFIAYKNLETNSLSK